jgi:sulfopyruvate decarboxylase TPP-binding subunit
MDEGVGPGRWQDDLYGLLRRNNVTQFAYVPDAGHRILIDRSLADPDVHSVALTSEETGWRCSPAPTKGGRFPFLTLVSTPGDFGEGNPWQFPMGQAVQPVLEAMGGNAMAVLLTQKLSGKDRRWFGDQGDPHDYI